MIPNSDSDSSARTLALNFEGLPEAVLLTGSPSLLQRFREHFALWPHTVQEEAFSPELCGGAAPLLRVRESARGGFRVSAAGAREERYDSAAAMLCDAGIDLAEAFVHVQSSLFCLHCSAVALTTEDGPKLAVFPNINRAGKSLLAASFLLHGGRIAADDLLGVTEQGEGLSFGLPPRLRLPLPPSSQELTQALPSIPGVEDGHYRFLYAGAFSLAAFGERCPIGAFILPRRTAGARPHLHRLMPQAALPWLVYQFQMAGGQAGAVFKLVSRLCRERPLWLLEYDGAEEAAQYLAAEAERLFSFLPEEEAPLSSVAFLTDEDRLSYAPRGRHPLFSSRKHRRWVQASSVAVHEEGDSIFLIPEAQDAIFTLDRIGQAVWALLAEPLSIAEAASLLADVFPQTGREKLERDMIRFFRTLFEQGLVQRA